MPSFTQASSSADPSPPRRTPNKPNWSITSEEVEQGCILWLGTPEETLASQSRRGVRQEPIRNVKTGQIANLGMFEHPILAVSRPASDPSKLYFLPMTSLAGKSLQQRYQGRKSSYHQATFVPVTPAFEHPHHIAGDTRYRTLTLEDGEPLERSTFVNIRELYVMDWRDAQLYWGANPTLRKPWKLDAPSVRSVTRLAGMNAGYRAEQQFRPNARQQTPPARAKDTPSPVLPADIGLGIEIPRSPVRTELKSSSAPKYEFTSMQWPTSPVMSSSTPASGVRLPPAPPSRFSWSPQTASPGYFAGSTIASPLRSPSIHPSTSYMGPPEHQAISVATYSPPPEQMPSVQFYGTTDVPSRSRTASNTSLHSLDGWCCGYHVPCWDPFAMREFVHNRFGSWRQAQQ